MAFSRMVTELVAVKGNSQGAKRDENAKQSTGWTLRLWPMPNITERIQNLTDERPV